MESDGCESGNLPPIIKPTAYPPVKGADVLFLLFYERRRETTL